MPRLLPMSSAPRDGLMPPRILVQFRGEVGMRECYWSGAFFGWVDDREGAHLQVCHNPVGWLPAGASGVQLREAAAGRRQRGAGRPARPVMAQAAPRP